MKVWLVSLLYIKQELMKNVIYCLAYQSVTFFRAIFVPFLSGDILSWIPSIGTMVWHSFTSSFVSWYFLADSLYSIVFVEYSTVNPGQNPTGHKTHRQNPTRQYPTGHNPTKWQNPTITFTDHFINEQWTNACERWYVAYLAFGYINIHLVSSEQKRDCHKVHDRKIWHKFISIIKNYNANCGMSCDISLLVPGGENCSAKWWWEEVI